jgi:hypothetical protein
VFGGDGFQLGGWGRLDEVFQDGHVEVFRCPCDEALQVDFADGADWVDVRGGAIVFCQVCGRVSLVRMDLRRYTLLTSAQTFVDVGASEDEKRTAARSAANLAQFLSKVVRDHHPRPSLDILQGEILRGRAAVNYE